MKGPLKFLPNDRVPENKPRKYICSSEIPRVAVEVVVESRIGADKPPLFCDVLHVF